MFTTVTDSFMRYSFITVAIIVDIAHATPEFERSFCRQPLWEDGRSSRLDFDRSVPVLLVISNSA